VTEGVQVGGSVPRGSSVAVGFNTNNVGEGPDGSKLCAKPGLETIRVVNAATTIAITPSTMARITSADEVRSQRPMFRRLGGDLRGFNFISL
jgi:hypothetical protein